MFIPDPDLDFLPIPDPGVKKVPDPQHWYNYSVSGSDLAKKFPILPDLDPQPVTSSKNTSESAPCGEICPVMSFMGFDCPVSVFRSLCFVTHRVQILLYTFLNYSDKLRVINLRHSFHYCILRSFCLTLSKLNANFFLVFTFYNVSLTQFHTL